MSSECFSKIEIDAIGEILNISLGASATAVSTMLSTRVDITTPIVRVVKKDEFEMNRLEPAVCVEITYVAGLEGKNVMLLKRHDVKIIVEMMMGMEISDEDFAMDDITTSAVCEVMNQMMGASATALSEFLGRMVNISTPVSYEVKSEQEFIDKHFAGGGPEVVVGFTLSIADKLESEFFNVMPLELAKSLIRGFMSEEQLVEEEEEEEAPAEQAPLIQEESAPVGGGGGTLSQEEIEKLLAGMDSDSSAPADNVQPSAAPAAPQPSAAPAGTTQAAQPAMTQPGAAPMAQAGTVPAAQPNMAQTGMMPQTPMMGMDVAAMQMQMQMMQQMMQQMQQMQQAMQKPAEEKKAPEPKMIHVQSPAQQHLKQDNGIVLEGEQEENMELIMSVPLEVSVEIGRTKKFVKDILDFTKGSLVVLDKLAGEQVDLFVNGQCIAKGDVVVVEDNFGIRITEIMRVNLNILE